MAGVQINVLPRQMVQVPTVTGTADYRFPFLARYIDALGWVSGTLLVSVYATNFTTVTDGPPKFRVVVANSMVSAEDPSQMVIPDGSNAHLAAVEFNITTATLNAPVLYSAKLPTPTDTNPHPAIGRYLAVAMVISPNNATALEGSLTLAVDLIGRDA